jgi:hypothetical protein
LVVEAVRTNGLQASKEEEAHAVATKRSSLAASEALLRRSIFFHQVYQVFA